MRHCDEAKGGCLKQGIFAEKCPILNRATKIAVFFKKIENTRKSVSAS